ncbi:para-aminobenzoate synthase, (PABA) [Tilletia horrida]|uniref:aminodeoxychorismate synthase n=1 Tax=Tilletia horrida TaxID=155126 RepID=A0AAN6GBZ2_9BASI|nr:para-aminobenzoate synthase, (PABA) [Tilletia horrida]
MCNVGEASSSRAAGVAVEAGGTTASPAMPDDWAPRLLIVDHFDSYTANLLTLLPPLACANTVILQHTHELLADPAKFASAVAPYIDAIIISPGPGSPENEGDFGTAARILRDCLQEVESEESISPLRLPVLGVCLGHQGIACALGSRLKRTRTLQHGARSALCLSKDALSGGTEAAQGLFVDIPEGVKVVRYNSLAVEEETLAPSLRATAWATDPPATTPAPCLSTSFQNAYKGAMPAPNALNGDVQAAASPQEGQRVLMALQHKTLPVAGVQFHPESIESEYGSRILANFLTLAWNFWASTGLRGPNPGAARSRSIAWSTVPEIPAQLRVAADGHTEPLVAESPLHVYPSALLLDAPSSSHRGTSPNFGALHSALHRPSEQRRSPSTHSDRSWMSQPSSTASLGVHSANFSPSHSSASSHTTASATSLVARLSPPGTPPTEKPGLPRAVGEVGAAVRWQVISQTFSPAAEGSLLPTALHTPQVFDRLFRQKDPSAIGGVWLDSARPLDPHSRYSYMAAPQFLLSYSTVTRTIVVRRAHRSTTELSPIKLSSGTNFWDWMSALQADLQKQTAFAPTVLQDDRPVYSAQSSSRACDDAEEQDRDATVFKGGFTGYFGYEMKAESLHLEQATLGSLDRPDAEFLFCDRVLCYDHVLGRWTAFAVASVDSAALAHGLDGGACTTSLHEVQRALAQSEDPRGVLSGSALLCTTEAEALGWFHTVSDALHDIGAGAALGAAAFAANLPLVALPTLHCDDTMSSYRDKVEMARKFIAAGESYELCITTAFRGSRAPIPEHATKTEADGDHFALYCALRAKNAAPYSAFFQLPSSGASISASQQQRGRSILSTSPERFIRVLRSGEAEMKPIKGTLARAGFARGEEHMLPLVGSAIRIFGGDEAEQRKEMWRREQDDLRRVKLAADPKERGENLMIVDLIRADLLSFCHPSSVRVPKLMRVETYATIHQLVTTVRGQLRPGVSPVEALRRCFPPGSMTGAPKRRSVQILQDLEAHGRQEGAKRPQRGIYSGALGWLGLDGAADFAVVIRTAVAEGNDLYIGAGGAVTFLSGPDGELSEMLDKARSVMPVTISP